MSADYNWNAPFLSLLGQFLLFNSIHRPPLTHAHDQSSVHFTVYIVYYLLIPSIGFGACLIFDEGFLLGKQVYTIHIVALFISTPFL